MENTFLPKGYEPPAGGGQYIKLQNGENKIRIMSSAITGYIYWTKEDKPVRSPEYPAHTPNIKTDENGKTKIQHFWAFVVWDYAGEGAIKIMEVTQAGIRDSLLNLVNDTDWGDPKNYDIKITKTGQKLETRYQVSPVPHREAPANAVTEYLGMNINLNALYSGGDPFGGNKEENTPLMQRMSDDEIDVSQIPLG